MANDTVKIANDPMKLSVGSKSMGMFVESFTKKIYTAIPVIVEKTYSFTKTDMAGYVDVRPVIKSVDNFGRVVEPAVIYKIPFMRYQAGNAAVILNPVVGDVGLAIFAQRDSSGLKQGGKALVTPVTARHHDVADGFYIGGFLNDAPETYIELHQDKTITVRADTVTFTGDIVVSGYSFLQHSHTGVHGQTTPPTGGHV